MENKISVVFPVMNRNHHVAEAVPTWIEHEAIGEIILVDWSSKIPLHLDENLKNIINHEKTRIIRVEKEEFFVNPALALNLGIDFAKYKNILKLDIDYKLKNNNILKILSRNKDSGHFFCGTVPEESARCFWGFCFFHIDDYNKIGGFNENFNGWGCEDADFYDRLEEVGVERTVVLNIQDFISHIDHDDSLRTENHSAKDKSVSNKSNGILSKSRLLFKKSKYELVEIQSNVVVLQRIKNSFMIR